MPKISEDIINNYLHTKANKIAINEIKKEMPLSKKKKRYSCKNRG